jgi:predicted Zn-dependent protease
VKVISHAVLTNHRIVATPNEPFSDSAFHMTTPELPDLVDLTRASNAQEKPSQLTLLKAYRQVMLSHPEYRERYWKMGKQLEASEPNNVLVLQALADLALQQKNLQGVMTAIEYLDRARKLGSTEPSDFEQLAKMLLAIHQEKRALEVLRQGIGLIPYEQNFYQLSLAAFSSLKEPLEGCKVAASASALFPQDDNFRTALTRCAGK